VSLLPVLESFFRATAPLQAGEGVVAAFSGGPDSAALLLGLSRLAGVRVTAAHLDHALDGGSGRRASAASAVAARLGLPFVSARRAVADLRRPGESTEAAARRIRYAFLEEVRDRLGARYVATGHHEDDQAETVLLRMLFGSGLAGLSGIRPVHGRIVRPLLGVPRAVLRAEVEAAGLSWIDDPTNRDLRVPRNLVRHRVLPALGDPSLPASLARLAEKARRAGAALEQHLEKLLSIRPLDDGAAVELDALRGLPEELLPFALAALHRRAGAPYPAGSAARAELLRQLAEGAGRLACDCGGGWRWEAAGRLLALRKPDRAVKAARFTYTLMVPGRIEIPELGVRVGLHHHPVEPWMFQSSPHRAGLALPLAAGDRVTVRNRRPGDRLHPLGAAGSRRLKEVLIDRRVPQGQRDRIPLLCVGERIAWVPGITIDQRFRITGEAAAWVAEVETR
jgi:tRNA(Ile)-lysidine synthase